MGLVVKKIAKILCLIVLPIMVISGVVLYTISKFARPECFATQNVSRDESIKKLVLDNGLTVLLLQKADIPKVFIQLTYGVGSAAEDAHERGIAHVIEHMIFKGTSKYSERDIPAIARKFGAKMNAATSLDFTGYYFETIKNNWQPFIEILADCMQNARFDKQQLLSELKTVIREIKSIKDVNSRVMSERMFELSFPSNHPYHFCIAGYKEDLPKLTTEDLKKFYQKYYRPDNALLFMIGNFDFDQAEKVIKSQFEVIKKPKQLLIKKTYPVIGQQALGQQTRYFEEIKAPQFRYFWTIPGLNDKKEAVASVLEFLLGNNKMGRLHKILVERAGVANNISVRATKHMDGGLFVISISPIKNMDEKCCTLVTQELNNIIKNGFSAEEVDRAINHKKRIFAEKLSNLEDFARDWSKSYFSTKDEKAIFSRANKYTQVKPDDLQKFVITHLNPALMNRLEVLPIARAKRVLSAKIRKHKDRLDEKLLKTGQRQTALESVRYAKKMANPAIELITFPRPDKVLRLPNGLTVLLSKREGAPYIRIECGLMGGDLLAASLDGVAVKLLMSLLLAGDEQEFFYKNAVACNASASGLSFSMLNSDYDAVIKEVGKIFQPHDFEPDVFDKLKHQAIKAYEHARGNPKALLHRTICGSIYNHDSYGWAFDDAINVLKHITLKDIDGLYNKYINASNLVIAIVGDFEIGNMQPIIEGTFAELPRGCPIKQVEPILIENKTVKNEDLYLARNTILLSLFNACPITVQDNDFEAIKLLEFTLFHSWGSRLFALREEYGLFYSSFGGFAIGAERGNGYNYFGAGLALDALDKTEKMLRAKMLEVSVNGINDDELAAAKQMYIRRLVDAGSSNATIARTFISLFSSGLGLDYYDKQFKRISQISLGAVNKAAKKHLNPENMVRIRIGRLPALFNANNGAA